MPGTDGYQVASFVKNSKLYSEIPVIVNSSMTTDAVRGKMKQIGVDGFVGKTDIPTLFDYTKRFLLH
jgi:two-component system chemotaxis response regulator CheV